MLDGEFQEGVAAVDVKFLADMIAVVLDGAIADAEVVVNLFAAEAHGL